MDHGARTVRVARVAAYWLLKSRGVVDQGATMTIFILTNCKTDYLLPTSLIT